MPPALKVHTTSNDYIDQELKQTRMLPEKIENGDFAVDNDNLQPLAIVGVSLRFPQDATSPEAFWEMLMEGRCVMTDYPKDRLNIDAFYHPDDSRVDTFSARGGHFVTQDLGAFDAPFFSITPAEASDMDPMQRGLLESTYRAFENAGMALDQIAKSKTSVYTGSFTNDYQAFIPKDPQAIPRYSATGCSPSMLANRLSWFFDLTGNSVNLDSACSSSLTALHFACQDLWNGESTMSVAAGCNLMFSVEAIATLSNMNFLSPDSRCHSFDHKANGYARGEGFGVVILKTLADAVKHGDTIRSVIRSTGSNQDGYTSGITQPSGEAQERLIKETYRKAGLSMKTTRFFEAHGTGTPLGDPIEANAIGRAFMNYRSYDEPLHVGAVKSNIGHLEGASGMAGLIKTVLILEKGIICPNTNIESLNPRIDAESLHLNFNTYAIPWPHDGLRRASVNSFGFGGTNCHVILDDAYNYLRTHNLVGNHSTIPKPPSAQSLGQPVAVPILPLTRESLESSVLSKPRVLVLSASDQNGISRLAKKYTDYMSNLSSQDINLPSFVDDLAHTLATHRTSLPWRSYTVLSSTSELKGIGDRFSKPVLAAPKKLLGFVFTGQGAQWPGMGQQLSIYPVFKRSLEEAEHFFRSLGSQWTLSEELKKPESVSRINEPLISQALCTALQVALVDLLRDFCILPSVVIGHSSGEIAAAYSTGAISRASAWKLAYFRGLLASSLAANSSSAMLAVGLSPEDIVRFFDTLIIVHGKLDVSVACYNSPTNITISGGRDQIQTLKALLDKEEVFARILQVPIAYHSSYMEPIAQQYLDLIDGIESGDAHVGQNSSMISSITGTKVTGDELLSGHYWIRNLVSPVKFADALTRIFEPTQSHELKKGDGNIGAISLPDILLEIGPHSALQAPIKQVLQSIKFSNRVSYDSLLVRNISSTETVMNAAARLYCAGYPVQLGIINQASDKAKNRAKILNDLPEYPFDHSKTYWSEGRVSKAFRFRKHPRLDLLGSIVPDSNSCERRWQHTLRMQELPWMEDHRINDSILYPAGGMLVMAVEAVKQSTETEMSRKIIGYKLHQVFFLTSLFIPLSKEGIDVSVTLLSTPRGSDRSSTTFYEFRIYSFVNNDWVLNCRGSIHPDFEETDCAVDGGREIILQNHRYHHLHSTQSKSCNRKVPPEQLYRSFTASGLNYGPAFRRIEELFCNDSVGEALGRVSLFKWVVERGTNHSQAHVIHPASLDGIIQMAFAAMSCGGSKKMPTMVPTRIHNLWVSNEKLSYPCSESISVCASSQVEYSKNSAFVVALDNSTKVPLVIVDGLEATIVASETDAELQSANVKLCYSIDWKPDFSILSYEKQLTYCFDGNTSDGEPVQFFQDLRLAVFNFVNKALKAVTPDQLETLQPHHQRYYSWMRLQSERFFTGTLPGSLPQWSILLQDTDYQDTLVSRLKENNKQGLTYISIGEKLVDILLGNVDPLALLFQTSLVSDYYEEISNNVRYLGPMKRYFETLVHKLPNMKILEVGGGTGGITRHVLNSLMRPRGNGEFESPLYSSYDFTDISPSFFAEVQAKFSNHGTRLKFSILNIDEDIELQNFTQGEYDMVIAASVLHVTKDLNHSIRRVRKLLKPGGKLVLIEPTKPENLGCSFIFGLLPGWWPNGSDGRNYTPLVSEAEWNSICTRNGFSNAEIVIPDYKDESCQETSIMVFTAVETAKSSVETGIKPMIIVDERCVSQYGASSLLENHFQQNGYSSCRTVSLQQASTRDDLGSVFFISLLDVDEPGLRDFNKNDFEDLKRILLSGSKLLWVSRTGENKDPPSRGIIDGLSRVSRVEDPTLILVTMQLQSKAQSERASLVDHIFDVVKATLQNVTDHSWESEYKEIGGILHIKRIVEDRSLDTEISTRLQAQQLGTIDISQGPPLAVGVASPGMIDSLQFVEDGFQDLPILANAVEVEVRAIGLNFMDLLAVLGRLGEKISLGTECAGVISKVGKEAGGNFKIGDRVVVACADTCKTFVRCPADCAILIPESLPFTDAAAIPTTFGTAYHCLHEIARVQKGETVLIHSAAGGTGQSAVQIAKDLGAEIFATVGSDSKKRFLMDAYNIPEDHIFYSRNTSFSQGVLRMTSGRGVDVVLNSLSGECLLASWECIAPYGRFIEIGKKDIHANEKIPMLPFAKNVTFSAVDMAAIMKDRRQYMQSLLKMLMEKARERAIIPAQPLQIFPVSDIRQAFRHLQTGQSMGKLVIELENHASVQALLKPKPKIIFEPDCTYVIAGGLGGVGRSISRWMVARGARNLILLSRTGTESEYAEPIKKELGCARIETPACDITNEVSLASCLGNCQEMMPPIKGCIQAAVVMKDAMFARTTFEDWTASLGAKVQGSWNLHKVLPRNMDFFVFLSSLSGIIGRETQAAYSAGNTYMDALAQYRVSLGQKAVAIDLGILEDEGMLAEDPELMARVKLSGALIPIRTKELHAILDYYCDSDLGLLAGKTCQPLIGLEMPTNLMARNIEPSPFMYFPTFRHFFQMSSTEVSSPSERQGTDFLPLFSSTKSITEIGYVVTTVLIERLALTISIPAEDISHDKPMHHYGVDSLVAIEIRNWFAKKVGADIAVFDILSEMSIEAVAIMAVGKSSYKKEDV